MSTKLESRKCQRIPEYDAAILSCSVTLQQIVEARHKLQIVEAQWNLHKRGHFYEEYSYEELLWRAYQHAHGSIEEYYFSMGGRAAVVLINPHGRRKAMDIDLYYPIDELSQLTPDFESTLWTCISQFQTIAELDLKFKSQGAVFLELYLIVIYIFVVVEAQQASRQHWYRHVSRFPKHIFVIEDLSSKRVKEALDYANDHISKLADKVEQFSKRKAQVVYIRGMFIGIFSVLTLVAVYVYIIFRVSATRHWTSGTQLLWHLIAIAVVSGALGAVVSVMLRVSNRPLSIAYIAGRSLIWLSGFFRPIVGAIFGLVFYMLISAGLLQVLAAPRDIGIRAFFVAAICFAAGFSERRAQDFIVRALPTERGGESDTDESPARRPEEGRIANNTSSAAIKLQDWKQQSGSTRTDGPGATTI
jgi:hypothetical protein